MLKTLSTVSALILIGTSACAAPVQKPKAAAKAVPLICPVTGEKIASVKDAVGSSTYHGKTYYFCCSGCKPLFDKNPAKYTKSAKAGKPTVAAAMPKM